MKFAYIVELYRLNYNFKRKFQREDWLSNIKEKNFEGKIHSLSIICHIEPLKLFIHFSKA